MSSFNDRLYNLIPAIYRIRDEESDGPLRSMLSVVSQQVDVIQRDIDQLYDNWFIETCDEWVVPYIGELVGHQPVIPTNGEITDPHVQARNRWLFPRREIAHIVKYRRRKGTLPVLEEIALDTAGWHALAVEFREQVAATPNLRYGGTDSAPKLPNFRDPDQADYFGGPFNRVGHTVNFRAMQAAERRPTEGAGDGRGVQKSVGLPIAPKSIGLWVWRNSVDSVTGVTPVCRVYRDVRYFTFHPLGFDTPLYNLPKALKDREEIAQASELPIALTRTLLGSGVNRNPDKNYYAAGRSLVIRIRGDQAATVGMSGHSGEGFIEIPASKIRVGSLSDQNLGLIDMNDAWFPHETTAIIDPELGRFVLKEHLKAPLCEMSFSPTELEVTYHHSVSGDLGGGEYYRERDPRRKMATWVVTPTEPPVRVDERCSRVSVTSEAKDSPIDIAVALLRERLKQLQAHGTKATSSERHLVLELAETGVYRLSAEWALSIPPGCTVEVRAAGRACPFLVAIEPGACQPLPIRVELHAGAKLVLDGVVVSAEGVCLTHVATVVKEGELSGGCHTSHAGASDPDEMVLPEPSRVLLRHSTLVPQGAGCCCEDGTPGRNSPPRGRLLIGEGVGEVCLDHSITGPIETLKCEAQCGGGCSTEQECRCCPPPATQLRILDSVVDGQGRSAFRTIPTSREKRVRLVRKLAREVLSAIPTVSEFVPSDSWGSPACHARVKLFTERSSFLGPVWVETLHTMSNCLVMERVHAERTQIGMIRFSHAPGEESGDPNHPVLAQPPRLRCQPDYSDLVKVPPSQVRVLMASDFECLEYGDPGYCQLRRSAPNEVRMGADDGGEMGVFHDQFTPHRELALERRLTEFTPATHTLSVLYIDEHRASRPQEDE